VAHVPGMKAFHNANNATASVPYHHPPQELLRAKTGSSEASSSSSSPGREASASAPLSSSAPWLIRR
jgi:hypothetical protein